MKAFKLSDYGTGLVLRRGVPESLRPSTIKAMLDDYVIGQDDAKKLLSIVVVNHLKIVEHNRSVFDRDRIKPTNMLLTGASGCGKTLIVETIAKYLKIPFMSVDITQFSKTGYIGRAISDILDSLYNNVCQKNAEKASRAIIFIDEIDKISANSGDANVGDFTQHIQYDLLKLIEGAEMEECQFDNRDVLFIFGGAFTEFTKKRAKAKKKPGFTAEVEAARPIIEMTHDDLIESGFCNEFVGRIGHIATLQPLTREQLKRIIIEPKNSVLNHFIKLGRIRGIDLTLSEAEINDILDEAENMGTGARALKVLAEKKLMGRLYV